jgi:hypothetical protein
MTRILRTFAVASALIIAGLIPAPAFTQKSGGVLIGTTVEYVASSMIDMLAGLSW